MIKIEQPTEAAIGHAVRGCPEKWRERFNSLTLALTFIGSTSEEPVLVSDLCELAHYIETGQVMTDLEEDEMEDRTFSGRPVAGNGEGRCPVVIEFRRCIYTDRHEGEHEFA